jgi:hypothetical protein
MNGDFLLMQLGIYKVEILEICLLFKAPYQNRTHLAIESETPMQCTVEVHGNSP